MAAPTASLALYRRLLGHVRPYWRMFALGIAGMVLAAATEPALPMLMKPMLDGTFVDRDPTWITVIPLLLIALFIARGVATFLLSYGMMWVGNRLVLDLRALMFDKLVRLPASYFERNASGNLISRLTYDVTQVTTAATNALTVFVKDGLTIVALLAWLLWLDWKLTLIALAMAPPIAWVVATVSRRLRRASLAAQQAMGDITHVLQEAVDNHKVVKVFGGADYERQRFHEASNRMRRQSMKQVVAAAANAPFVQLVAAISVAIILWVAIDRAMAGAMSVGHFVSFITAMLLLTAPLKRITNVNEFVQKGLAAAQTVFEVIDELPEPDHGRTALDRARGELRFERVSLRYPGAAADALRDIDLVVRPGETVALVGASGAGKSTLASLIPRFHNPTSGRILLDGIDLQDITLASLRRQIALVSQEVTLFNDTIAANIAYGGIGEASRADLERAARAAHAWEFIAALPDGLDTLVGENGARLSGGQRQRLAIARAFLKDAPILILDEATSALDTESERQVQAALRELARGRTTIVIAHRLSTIEAADRIVVLEAGRVVETGAHPQLVRQGGLYARLHAQQGLAA
jgi:subfamily B ATP-binding cassette protein MsbA